jgi:hypothetical protein
MHLMEIIPSCDNVCQPQRNHPQILEINIFSPTTENLMAIFYPLSVFPHLETLLLKMITPAHSMFQSITCQTVYHMNRLLML